MNGVIRGNRVSWEIEYKGIAEMGKSKDKVSSDPYLEVQLYSQNNRDMNARKPKG
jgi:hypothetical protein